MSTDDPEAGGAAARKADGSCDTDPDAALDHDPAQAARSALRRAQQAARDKGLRPGMAARPRRTVAGWRGSGSGPDARDPQMLASTLRHLVDDRGWEADLAVGGAMGRWCSVVGETVSEHCVPQTFADGVLTVVADSTAWATQVRMLAPNLLRRLDEELGEGTVTKLVVRGPGAPSWRRGSRRVAGRGPRDTYG